jgi:hypothetical protein
LEFAVRKESNQSLHRAQLMKAFDRRVWQEIQYLDSPPCDHENFILPEPKPAATGQLELLDDQVKFPWAVLIEWSAMAAATCAIVIVLICDYC